MHALSLRVLSTEIFNELPAFRTLECSTRMLALSLYHSRIQTHVSFDLVLPKLSGCRSETLNISITLGTFELFVRSWSHLQI